MEHSVSSGISLPAVTFQEIDRSQFSERIHVRALKVSKEICSEVSKILNGHLFERPRLRHILVDPEDRNMRLVLLHPDIQGLELAGLPDERKQKLREKGIEGSMPHTVTLDYSYFSADAVLRKLLPDHLETPTSFETIGHVAHINLRDELLPYKSLIGQVLLEKNSPRIRTVVNKVGTIESEFRVPQLEVLAGDDSSLETCVKEHGATFMLNYSEVYWNSRLEHEHARLVSTYFQPGQVICDMFAGVGPFAIPAALAGCTLLANDLNPASTRYLAINAKRNKVSNRVRVLTMDARLFMREICTPPSHPISSPQHSTDPIINPGLNPDPGSGDSAINPRVEPPPGAGVAEAKSTGSSKKKKGGKEGAMAVTVAEPWKHFDHAVMNLPASAIEFLDVFNGLLSRSHWTGAMPLIHCYCFAKAHETDQDVVNRASGFLGCTIENPVLWNVRDVAPNKSMLCLTFRLPKAVAFYRGKEEEGGTHSPLQTAIVNQKRQRVVQTDCIEITDA